MIQMQQSMQGGSQGGNAGMSAMSPQQQQPQLPGGMDFRNLMQQMQNAGFSPPAEGGFGQPPGGGFGQFGQQQPPQQYGQQPHHQPPQQQQQPVGRNKRGYCRSSNIKNSLYTGGYPTTVLCPYTRHSLSSFGK
jgi:hypothetical protein